MIRLADWSVEVESANRVTEICFVSCGGHGNNG